MHKELCRNAILSLPNQFGQELHVPNLGCNAVLISIQIVFHSDDRSLAANPALFTARELRGQYQNHFNIVSLPDRKVGIKKYSIRTQVARMSGGLEIRVGRRNRDRNLHWNAFSGSPLSFVIGHRRGG